MRKMREKESITFDMIGCDEIKENMKACEDGILGFVKVIRNYIEIGQFIGKNCPPQETWELIKKSPFFTKDSMYIRISRNPTAGYIGNDRCDAVAYEVIWAFNLTGETIDSKSWFDFDEEWIEKTLYFRFTQDELLPMHKASRTRFFEVYVAGLNYSENAFIEKYHQRIARNTDNYPLTSILNPKVAARTILQIRKVQEEYALRSTVEQELIQTKEKK